MTAQAEEEHVQSKHSLGCADVPFDLQAGLGRPNDHGPLQMLTDFA